MLHLQKIVWGPLNVLANLMPVSRPIKKRSQDKHVQRALQQISLLLCLFLVTEDVRPSMGSDGRHSTIHCQGCKSGVQIDP
jgi:hypothetical protein